ncbi:hypothetical protein BASA81_011150 [Batrachochytrium salamandrivorans]|nr:hypothetical protein BASA81_011150 [Batrachochytrium salamandrivorans]
MAHFRLLGALGYGVFTLLVVNNIDGASDYMAELGRTTVHFLSRSKDRLANAGVGGDFSLLSDKIDRLSQMNRDPVIINPGGYAPSSAASWITTILGGTLVTLGVVHLTGLFDLSGIMYVTQHKFKLATEQLERGVKALGDTLAKTRTELLTKLGVVERNLEQTRKELKGEIQSSSAEIRKDVKVISGDIKHLHSDVAGLDTKMDGLHDGVGELRAAIEHANRGIALLCHVVAESFFHRTGGGTGTTQDKAVKDLMTFTKTNPIQVTNGSADLIKQIKFQAGDGPIMRLMSAVKSDQRELLEKRPPPPRDEFAQRFAAQE